jgi:hypothetical protein
MTKIVYFGKNEHGYFVDHEGGSRDYVSEELWWDFVRAGGKGPDDIKNGEPIKLKITEQVTLRKFDGDIGPDSVPVETIVLE